MFAGRRRELETMGKRIDDIRRTGEGRSLAIRGRRQVGKSGSARRVAPSDDPRPRGHRRDSRRLADLVPAVHSFSEATERGSLRQNRNLPTSSRNSSEVWDSSRAALCDSAAELLVV